MTVNAFIQNAKGSYLRYRFNESTLEADGCSRLLAPAAYQYGFIPGTVGGDGDCIDIWLIDKHSYEVGSIVPCRVLGILEMYEDCCGEHEEDCKIIAVPEGAAPHPDQAEIDCAVGQIKEFTIRIFEKYPEVKISFGRLLPKAEAESFIKSAIYD